MKLNTFDTTRKTKFWRLTDKDQGAIFLYNNEPHIFTGSSAYSDFQAVNLATGNYAMIYCEDDIEIVNQGVLTF